MLVEDEEAVRALVERLLRKAGYEVLVAADGARALELESRADGRIDLLLTDVVMPGMSGIELAREIRARRPGTRVLLISGYTEESVGTSGPGAFDLLAKPFTENELLTRVRSILGD
jgi:DNA-binding response OmpR family regulator